MCTLTCAWNGAPTEWNLKSLFGKTVASTCPLATSTKLFIAEESPAAGLSFSMTPPSLTEELEGWAVYDLADLASEC